MRVILDDLLGSSKDLVRGGLRAVLRGVCDFIGHIRPCLFGPAVGGDVRDPRVRVVRGVLRRGGLAGRGLEDLDRPHPHGQKEAVPRPEPLAVTLDRARDRRVALREVHRLVVEVLGLPVLDARVVLGDLHAEGLEGGGAGLLGTGRDREVLFAIPDLARHLLPDLVVVEKLVEAHGHALVDVAPVLCGCLVDLSGRRAVRHGTGGRGASVCRGRAARRRACLSSATHAH
mmetsp:Transcript_119916/g.339927  ORF Transcript_119916/g.339927 Transcript_119916/m.339927 type:complete len:230 (+) Transcript_119916:74-763(+)